MPDDPLAPGTYSMRIDPPGGGSTSGLPAIASFDVPITAGVTTIVTARGDSLDSLEFTISTERIGVADADEQAPLPTRIDTGAGGTAHTDSQAPPVPSAALAVTALLAAFTAWRLRPRTGQMTERLVRATPSAGRSVKRRARCDGAAG